MRKKQYFEVPEGKTKFRWDRNANYYWVVAHLSEMKSDEGWPEINGAEKEAYNEAILSGWHSFILRLTSPILAFDLSDVIITNDFRIYPPFELDIKGERSSSFDDVNIPVGENEVKAHIVVPDHATKGASADAKIGEAKACYGLRIDARHGIEIDDIVLFFIQLCRQYSRQWWLSSPYNPFDTGVRLNFDLNKDYSPRDIMRYRGAKDIESTWRGVTGITNLIGFESYINSKIWSEISNCMKIGYGVEDAMEFFLNGVSSYMSGEDRQCIMNLALMFEVAENKSRMLRDMNDVSKNKDLLKKPIVANENDVDIFRKIITDRDNIAHGRAAYHLKKDPIVMLDYLECAAEYINRYLDACRDVGWDRALKTSL